MTLFQEYALLVAVSLPVIVIVAIQVFLFISGERGTLLLPNLRPFASIVVAEEDRDENAVPTRQPVAEVVRPVVEPVRELERKAA